MALFQGFSIQGAADASFDVNQTVLDVIDPFTVAFVQPGQPDLSVGAGGTIQPAKQIIVLSVTTFPDGYLVKALLWLAARNPVAGSGTSLYPAASAQELAALAAGWMVELEITPKYGFGSTQESIEADLVVQWAAQESVLLNPPPTRLLSAYYNGTWN